MFVLEMARAQRDILILSIMPIDSLPDFLAHGPIFLASTPYATLLPSASMSSTFSFT